MSAIDRSKGRYALERSLEDIRVVLEGLVEDLTAREEISGIGLFGSWSRGDAVAGSDVDLLVVDAKDFDYEYVQRARIENIFLDLDHIPEKWIHERVPPEVDQKLFETEVLYDRDGTLQQAKDLISNIYLKPARVEIRTGNYLMEADTYLSRGFSAYNKDDFQSAKVNGVIGLDAIMKILIEVNRLPISNSRFVRAVESSTKRFGAPQLYDEYVKIAGLSKLPRERAEGMLDSVLVMWKEASEFFEANSASVERLHVRVMKDLSYYCRDSFVRGLAARASSLVNDGLFAEAAHYMFRSSVSMLENFVWLVSALEGTRLDYTALFQNLKESKVLPKRVYEGAVEAFGIEEVSGRDVEESLGRIREIILGIRQKRKELIVGLLS